MPRHLQKLRMADRKRMRTIQLFCVVTLFALLPGRGVVVARYAVHQTAGAASQGVKSEQSLQRAQPSGSILVAQGEYKVYRQTSDGGIGPFNPALHDFAESWSLWRLPDGTLQAEGDRTYEAPQFEAHKDGFAVHLSPKFNLLRLTEYKKLQWRPDSGPLTCDFRPDALDCDSGAKDPSEEVRLRLPLDTAYGFLWPISAFSMSNITRFPHREPGDEIPVSMLTVDEPSAADPVLVSVLRGNLRFLGQEQTTIAGKKWQADKFELKVALNAPFMLWTSPQGLLLDLTLEDNAKRLAERGMELVRYQQFADY
jgi:hypothetical protein